MRTKIVVCCLCFALGALSLGVHAQAPTFEISEPIILFGETLTAGANLAINTDEPEVLFTTIDTDPIENDPLTGEPSRQALYGFFYNPNTLEATSDPFIIIGNPDGVFETQDIKYNPVSKQYVAIASAKDYRPNGTQLALIAIINPLSAGGNIVKTFVHEADSPEGYDDVSIAISSVNGNMLIACERKAGDEGESVIGSLYDKNGNLLTPAVTRLDQLQSTGDEDDPDVVYLENNDTFLYITNTDNDDGGPYYDRITGSIIQTTPGADGELVVGEQQVLGAERNEGVAQGHPAAIANPFNDELVGAFDYSNGSGGGDLFYFKIGPSPTYQLTEAREQVPYLEAVSGDPYNHRHPQLAADINSGVIVVSNNASGSITGMVFSVLDTTGALLPGPSPEQQQFLLVETSSAVDNGANNHNIKYDPSSDSFLVIYATGDGFTEVVRLTITSDHTVPVKNWSIY